MTSIPQVRELIERASALLGKFERALLPHGAEMADLRAAKVSPPQIASLYPYDEREWNAGVERMEKANSKLVVRPPFASRQRYGGPEFLTKAQRQLLRNLSASLTPDVPGASYVINDWNWFLHPGSNDSGYVMVSQLIRVLLTLATGPSAPHQLAAEPIRQEVQQLLDATQALLPRLPLPEVHFKVEVKVQITQTNWQASRADAERIVRAYAAAPRGSATFLPL